MEQESMSLVAPDSASHDGSTVEAVEKNLASDADATAPSATAPTTTPAEPDLSKITSADLSKLRKELQKSLQEEDIMLNQQMELLVQRKDLVCKVETAEMDEQLSKLSTQQEKLNQMKLRMQLEGMYY
jgi:hypothetical protein